MFLFGADKVLDAGVVVQEGAAADKAVGVFFEESVQQGFGGGVARFDEGCEAVAALQVAVQQVLCGGILGNGIAFYAAIGAAADVDVV